MNIVIVCTGNTCRSPIAEALLKQGLESIDENLKNYKIHSAGISTVEGLKASRNSIEVLKEANIDLENHRSTPLTYEMIKEANIVLTMTKAHKDIIIDSLPEFKEKIFTLREFADGEEIDIIDPFGGDLEVYKRTAYDIHDSIKKILEKIPNKKKDFEK